MNNANSPRFNEYQDNLSSQSSDEKMDTGSESFLSTQNTPNSVLSSDFDDKDQSGGETERDTILRLQNPKKTENTLLKPSDAQTKTPNGDLNDSFMKKMSLLRLESFEVEEIGKKLSSTLTITTSHPLMGLGSPDSVENYPDVIPKKIKTVLDEPKDLSLSSIEDEKNTNETNSFTEFYSPQRNTSKSNLYCNDNFTTAESQEISRIDNLTSQPDVARVHSAGENDTGRRKIIAPLNETILPVKNNTLPVPQRALGRIIDGITDDSAILKYVEERNKKQSMCSHSTPNKNEPSKPSLTNNFVNMPNNSRRVEIGSSESDTRGVNYSISVNEEFHSAVADWVESPSKLRAVPNFHLPVEMSSQDDVINHDLDSPDVLSSSTQEDKSSYQATVDPFSGSVALRHHSAARPAPPRQRRRITLPPEQDSISLDSESLCSLESDEDAVDPEPDERAAGDRTAPQRRAAAGARQSDDDSKRDSSPTVSEYSEPIPEYSAADERREERGWMSVALADGGRANCDMKVIEPYKRVLSHGGYEPAGAAIIVFSACHLPDTARRDYTYVMDNLFLYVIWSLERLVTDEYVLVYLHGSAARRRLPAWRWLHECYKLIDRRLRKSLKHLYLVHPTFWLKSVVMLSKPFVSSKFFRKLSYVRNLNELMDLVPVEPNAIPDLVKAYDLQRR